MKSGKPSHSPETDQPIAGHESREWDELADAIEPLENRSNEDPRVEDGSRDASPVEEKEKVRQEKERVESRSHEDLVKSGVERAADDQEVSSAMRSQS
ncbi:hypothetical protein [Pelagicoccus sp. SDUM812002]|uniref:hypothetical protein n=1 Tax=Pelagicoccus sp. SDUM812002 TaxID=3041266 RepID=UPI0028109AAB|nr:hypothetical protein [Pelagicoccus sp. SDUM812002]MDQ8184806.1 hypothetical protein [Pelagicoccus sp. SDUM812002]